MSVIIAASEGSAPSVVVDTQNNQAVTTGSAPAGNGLQTPENQGSEPAKPLGDKGVEELITQRKKRQEAEKEAAYWRGVAQGGNPQPQVVQPQVVKNAPPVLEAFENYDDYLIAKTKHELREELRQEQRQSQSMNVEAQFQERVRKAAEKDPEVLEALSDRSLMISVPMAEAIKESEQGPEIAVYLRKHPAEAARIASLSPLGAAREIGRIESKIAPTTQIQRISQAPEPIKTVGGNSGAVNVDLEKISMEDFAAQRNAAQYKRR